MSWLLIRCARCHADVMAREVVIDWRAEPELFEFDHVCRGPITIAEFKARGLEMVNTTREVSYSQDPRFQGTLISGIKNQTINRIKAPGAAVSSSEKRAQTRANSGVAKNPSKQKRRFLAKKNQPNNQTSH